VKHQGESGSQGEILELERQAADRVAAGDRAGAITLYEEIVHRGGADEYTWAALGECYSQSQEYARARDAYSEAIARRPDEAALHVNIARPLYLLGEADEAAAHLERALPDMPGRIVLENLAVMAPGVPSYSPRRILEIRTAYGIALARPDCPPVACLAEAEARGPEALRALVPPRAPRRQRQPGDPLRVAYLSAHFAQANYMGPVWALINHHDRATHKVFLLSDAPIRAPFPDYAADKADTVADISTASDADLTQWIAAQQIDLLVDLSGYSYRPRLSLFASRPAPAVATWFNMYATSGLPGIDFIIGDHHVVRAGEEAFYSETVLRLPQSYLTFTPWEGRPPVAPSPAAGGAPFTFGSLVSLYKITNPVVEAWCAILQGAPEARLILANGDMKSLENRRHLIERFACRGIEPGRIVLRDPAPHEQFLRYYDEIDLALDSFPYSGGTTTMEALWQGVPVLTQAEGGWPARTTGTLLESAHLNEFCCRGVAQYVEKGIALAGTASERLAALRPRLRDSLRGAPALDGAALARAMEALYADI
jgi:protein O-GlcNAc transferase